MRAFWEEFRRRNVFRVGAAYLAVAWLLIQLVANVGEMLQAPPWIGRATLVLVVIGFPVALILAWLLEPGADQGGGKSAASPLRRRLNATIVAALALAVVVLLADKYLIPSASTAAASSPVAATSKGARLERSVAVLPPRNLSPDPKDADFAGGMQDEIIDRLLKLKALTVIARTSTMRYANTDKTIQQIGEELNVASVMESSLRYANDRVRISTNLYDAISGKPLWGETYERDFKDYFAVQADIAMRVANALDAAFSPEEQRQVEKVPTTSSEAYRLGMQLNELVGRGNESERVIALAEQAIAHDPNFALPYAYMAYTYGSLLVNSTVGPAGDPAELEPLATRNAEKARELDPDSNWAAVTLCVVNMVHWRWTSARRYSDDYLKKAAPLPEAVGGILWLLVWSGQGDRAIELGKETIARDPNNFAAHWYLAWAELYLGHDDEAATEAQRAIDVAPTLTLATGLHAWVEIARGHNDAALRELQQMDTAVGGGNRSIIVLLDLLYGFSRVGSKEDVNRLLMEIQALPSSHDLGNGGRATVYLATGQESKALEELRLGAERARNKVIDPGFLSLMNLRMNRGRDPVLEKPEFVAARKALQGD